MDIFFRGVIRKFTSFALGGAAAAMRLTGFESLAVAQIEPARLEWTRAGYRFAGGTQVIANGIAPVAAIPTTTATLALFNRDRDQSLIIEQLGAFLGSGTAAAGATILACVTRELATPVSANASGYSSGSLSGSPTASRAFWGTGVTVATDAWFQLQSTFQPAAANAGQGEAPIDVAGAIIIPPRCALGLAILSGAGTSPLYSISAIWSEAKVELE